MSTQYYFPPYNPLISWSKFDVAYGMSDGVAISLSDGRYYYATQDVPIGNYSPLGVYSFNVSSYSRSDDIMTLTYTHTGGLPFAPGSIIGVSGTTNGHANYTGMVLEGGSGRVSYVSPGWPVTAASVGTITCLNPGWTTGFFFKPTYSTKLSTQNTAIITQLGDGYQQRMPNQVNTFNQTFNLVYQNRGKREMRAINNYCQDKAGTYAFEILMPDQYLNNQPNQKWVCAQADVTTNSFGLYDITVPVSRVFDLN